MSATIRLTCAHNAPSAFEALNDINKHFRHPVAQVDGEEHPLDWDAPTEISVSAREAHEVRVSLRVLGLHFCGARLTVDPIPDGESRSYRYHLEVEDRWANRGHLDPVS